MKKTKGLVPKKRLLTACLLLFSLFFIHQSCTKLDTSDKASHALTEAEITQKFFNVPANAPLAVRRAANEMRSRNTQVEFVRSFAANNGYPAWDKATVAVHSRSVASVSFTAGGSNITDADTIVTIPVVPQNAAFVSGFVSATLSGEVSLSLYRGSDYAAYSFNDVPQDSISADKAALQLMVLNNQVFGSTVFTVKDNRLFSSSTAYNPSLPEKIFTLHDPQGGNLLELCGYICGNWVCKICRGQDPNCPIGGSGTVCAWVTTGCNPVDDGNGSGGGAGGSGGGGGTPNFPCASPQGRSIGVANPCGGSGPPPIVPNPTIPPVDPCIAGRAKAKQMDSLYSKSKSDSVINANPGLATATTETGFALYKKFSVSPYNIHDTTIGSYYHGPAIQCGATGVHITFADPFPYLTLHAGTHHFHPPDGFSAQSAADVYDDIGFQLFWSWFEGALVTSANGENHAVSIMDYGAATAFYNTRAQNLEGDHWNYDSEIGKSFKNAIRFFLDKYNADPNKDNLAYEMAMAAVLKEFNTGTTLFKQNATGKFMPIIVNTAPDPADPTKKIYTIVNCDIE